MLAPIRIIQVTHRLRAQLSLASYKAAHNLTHIPLRELEAQIPLPPPSTMPSRTNAAKRKAPAPGSNAMLPFSSHSHHHRSNVINGHTSTSQPVAGSSSSTVDLPHTQTLFTSLLAPPPPTQARTILNAHDPPIPAPVRPAPSPKSAEGTRAQAKNRESPTTASTAPVTASPNSRRKGKRPAPTEKGGPAKRRKENKRSRAADNDGDLDMEAAATLTSLLLHHRPSIAGSASSPRSSVDGGAMSDGAGSTQSQAPSFSSAYSQNTARGVASAMSSTTLADDRGIESRSRTPPLPGSKTPIAGGTPRPPTDKDSEAADLMLFLATSPSPARPTNKDKDLNAYRALTGGGVKPKGRVLFPSHGSPAGELPVLQRDRGHGPALLSRNEGGGSGSFYSSVSSIGSEMGVHSQHDRPPSRSSLQAQQSQGNLLPPATVSLAPSSPLRREMERNSPRASGTSTGGSTTPGPDNFNINEYINASPNPSPVRGGVGPPVHHIGGPTGSSKGLGLRADVGRKLFEEEQMRLGLGTGGSVGSFGANIPPQHQYQQVPAKVGGRPSAEHASAAQMHLQGRRNELAERGRSLDAGIDLVQT
ncbi:hypothetical protein VNI00_013253 [Paramarasmius palmivorus]|uniref:Uncharacterized protein n=1 Tax=Paramarasmius palmivorus TaxID=297713 RepID=A0AAW0C2I0_9AGAR